MKKSFTLQSRILILAVLIFFVWFCRLYHTLGEWYAVNVYPTLSSFLSVLTSWIPFSLEEIVVLGVVVLLIGLPIVMRRHRKSWYTIAMREAEILAWVYIWFYWGWGLNYFRLNFYQRMEVRPVTYSEPIFRNFLSSYIDSLNHSYYPDSWYPERSKGLKAYQHSVVHEIQSIYGSYPPVFRVAEPKSYQYPKQVLFNPLYSAVGVLGFMGPFFSESQLNDDLLPAEYPFTYAHELAHLLGVSSEAEANFWAYQTCISSSRQDIRYSGCLGILGYVLLNAQMSLSAQDFDALMSSIRVEVRDDFKAKLRHWDSLRSPLLDRVQSAIFEWYLKGNQIPDALHNYNEVVGMILAWESRESRRNSL